MKLSPDTRLGKQILITRFASGATTVQANLAGQDWSIQGSLVRDKPSLVSFQWLTRIGLHVPTGPIPVDGPDVARLEHQCQVAIDRGHKSVTRYFYCQKCLSTIVDGEPCHCPESAS